MPGRNIVISETNLGAFVKLVVISEKWKISAKIQDTIKEKSHVNPNAKVCNCNKQCHGDKLIHIQKFMSI